jgi:hypothetical protein
MQHIKQSYLSPITFIAKHIHSDSPSDSPSNKNAKHQAKLFITNHIYYQAHSF